MTALLLASLISCAEQTSLTDAHNYTFSSSLEAQSQQVATRTDLPVDWSGVSVDLQGVPLDAAEDIGVLSIVILALDQEPALEAFVNDALLMVDVVAFATFENPGDRTEAMLTEFDFLGNPVVPEEHITEGQGSWLLTATTPGQPGTRMLSFFEPLDGGPEDTIVLNDDSAELDFAVQLDAGEPLTLSGESLRWADLTLDMRGLPIRLSEIDRIVIGRYDEGVEEIEAGFLQVELLAEESWSAPLSAQVEVDLATLVNEDGQSFSGIDKDSTWVLALRCMSCANPAPPFMAVLAP